ncbi:MAG: hypothetical protein JO345_22535 [Streptosporangiaceae bacterium]|nr:hypothetical protein [Streptosporangiaceae bacterium]
MRARGSAPQPETKTGMTSRPGTRPAARAGHGGSPPHLDEDADLDAYIQRLVDAAPPLTAEQRDTLALLLRRPRRR